MTPERANEPSDCPRCGGPLMVHADGVTYGCAACQIVRVPSERIEPPMFDSDGNVIPLVASDTHYDQDQVNDLERDRAMRSADIVVPRHPHTLVCPVCGLTRHLPDGWQAMLGSETLTCTADQVVMVEARDE